MSAAPVLPTDRRAGLRDRIGQLGPDTPARWGRMNAHQMICHLADSLRFALGEREPGPLRYSLPAWLVRFVALSTPIPWPKGAPTASRIDQARGGTPPTEFGEDRAELELLLERFGQAEGSAWPVHPIMGRMSRAQWGTWAWKHFDHHLRQFGV